MALTRRALAATLAGLALAGTAAAPAPAYWRATGRATRAIPTATAAANVITLTQFAAQGKRVLASGTAGTGGSYGTSVTVTLILCKENTWPCPPASVVATPTGPANAGNGSYTVQSPNLSNVKVYGRATQTQTSGWTDYSALGGPVTF